MSNEARNTFIINQVKEIIGSEVSMEIPFDDPRIKDIIGELKQIQVRREALLKDQLVISPKNSERVLQIVRKGETVQKPSAKVTLKPKKKKAPKIKKGALGYVEPSFHDDVVAMLLNPNPQNMWFWGPTGCGKSQYVKHLGKQLERKVFRINCREDMDSATFIGDKTIEIDEKTGQNHIQFIEGQVLKAMREGLNDKGEVSGKPGILYIDEIGAMPTHIGILLNRVLETSEQKRSVAIDALGGKVVYSHPEFRIVCSANTQGRGLVNDNDSGYHAQTDALDDSILNRMSAFIRFGYNRKAEALILEDKIGEVNVVNTVLKFRDKIRDFIRQGKIQTPFSTRQIIDIAEQYITFKDLGKAMWYSVFNGLPQDELDEYNEVFQVLTGKDMVREMNKKDDMDFL